METYLLHCKKCGKMYKATLNQDNPELFITDFGQEINQCQICGSDFDFIKTEPWIATLVFSVTGK